MSDAGPGIFRHARFLPVGDAANAISLGEGNTPLIDLSHPFGSLVGGATLHLKCEHMNPTGSFKDRIAAVAATVARERGIRGIVGTSSGNGGAAISAYAARAGLTVTLFAISDILPQKLLEIRSFGGRAVLLRGLGHLGGATEQAAVIVCDVAHRMGLQPFITASRFSPEAMEGAKTIAYELAAQRDGASTVYVPIGGGGLFAAIWRGYLDLTSTLTTTPPRMVAVQPEGCHTVRQFLETGSPILPGSVDTTVSGLQVGSLFEAAGVAAALRESGGHYVEVRDEEVWQAQRRLAETGILTEPAGATALAGAIADGRDGRLDSTDRVVVLATGAGYKDRSALERLAPEEPPEEIGPEGIESLLQKLMEATA